MPSKDLLGIFFVIIFSCILVTSNVQQPSYKHATVCIFLYKYILQSINNQNRPHTLGHSIQFLTLLIFLDLQNEIVKEKCKAMATYGGYNFLTNMKFEQPLSTDTTKAIFIQTSFYLCIHTETCHKFPKIYEPPQNPRHQKGYTKQVPY